MDKEKICVIGAGRWGKNHIKTLYKMGNLAGVVDSSAVALNVILKEYENVKGFQSMEEAVKDKFDGYIIATPAESHFKIGEFLLNRKCNVLIEKPLTLSSEDSLKLIELSKINDARLMVGHVLLFHPAIKKIKDILDSKKLGCIRYIYSNRLNLGTVRTEENVFWSFAPHDISIFDYIIGKPPVYITASGGKFLQEGIHDVVTANITYPDNIKGQIFVSWLHPFKEQRLVIICDKGMITFEDSSANKEVFVYNSRIDWADGKPVKIDGMKDVVEYDNTAPLENELRYFIGHLNSEINIADGKSGYEVVKILEKVSQSLNIQKI